MKRILSVDGGGIRGLISAVVCQKIEEWTGTPIHQLFDLVAGTSTGGIIAMGFLVPPNGKPAKELVKFYKDNGPRIFANPRGCTRYIRGAKYANTELCRVLAEYFGDIKIGDAIKDVLVTAYDIERRAPLYISKRRAQGNKDENYPMREVGLGTSAAPTYFPPARVGDHVVIDGGVVANNPACVAYAEARQLWGPDEELVIVSIGTGTLNAPLDCNSARKWGSAGWAGPVIDCMFDAGSKSVEDFLRYTMRQGYWRLQYGLSERTQTLDGVSRHAMLELEQIGEAIARNNETTLMNEIVPALRSGGKVLSANIERPTGERPVPHGRCDVFGSISGYADEKLYLVTGAKDKFWPSARIVPSSQGKWDSTVNLGESSPTASIRLVKVDQNVGDYFEFYRRHVGELQHRGVTLAEEPPVLAQVHVVVNLGKR